MCGCDLSSLWSFTTPLPTLSMLSSLINVKKKKKAQNIIRKEPNSMFHTWQQNKIATFLAFGKNVVMFTCIFCNFTLKHSDADNPNVRMSAGTFYCCVWTPWTATAAEQSTRLGVGGGEMRTRVAARWIMWMSCDWGKKKNNPRWRIKQFIL